MLKEFIEHIQKTTQPLITNVNGSTFRITSDGDVKEILPTIFHPCIQAFIYQKVLLLPTEIGNNFLDIWVEVVANLCCCHVYSVQ